MATAPVRRRPSRLPLAIRPSALDAGILTVSLAILLVELLLTRIFSVVMYHHFSFLSVSLAMTGIGLGGLLVTLMPRVFRHDNLATVGPALALAFALAVVLAGWTAFNTPIKLAEMADNARNLVWILVTSLVPFVLGGLVLAHILAFNAERAHRLYFFDLLGAGLACMLFAPLVRRLGAPAALLVAAAAGMLGGVFLARGRAARATGALLVLAAIVAAELDSTRGFFDLRFAKGGQAAVPTLVTRWNAFSRVEVRAPSADLDAPRAPLGVGYSSLLRASARELSLLYDADALTQIVGFDGNLKSVEYLLWDVTSAPHHVRPNASVLVIGAGGGRDVLAALAAGSASVTGVEINDVTVDLMRNRFRQFTGDLYVGRPGVRISVEDGRSFVEHTDERFDLIQASLIDTWAASAAGAYALAENSLYTTEAFRAYLSKLQPDGMVSFSRWYTTPPVEILRLVLLAKTALAEIGVDDPGRHIAIVRTDSRLTRAPSLATVLVKRSPFTVQEIGALRAWAAATLFDLAYLPAGGGSEPRFAVLLGSPGDAARLLEQAPADLSPTIDDRPFFFDRVPLLDWLRHRLGLPAPAWAAGALPLATQTLLVALVVTAINAALLISLPALLTVRRRDADSAPRALGPRLAWIACFACLGVGYIVVEIVLIQRLNLYLGNPAHALTVVLFTMLVSSGLGSLYAERWPDARALPAVLAGVCIGIALIWTTIDPFVYSTLGAAQGRRIALAVLYVAPVAFVMGMPFPTALREAGRCSASLVPWAWAVNGATSVLGSVVAVVISMAAGFSFSLILAGVAYGVALALSPWLGRAERRDRWPASAPVAVPPD